MPRAVAWLQLASCSETRSPLRQSRAVPAPLPLPPSFTPLQQGHQPVWGGGDAAQDAWSRALL